MSTPRERVLAAINHREPDQVAIDFNGHRSSGIMAIAYAKLRRHLGLPERPIYIYDFIQQLAIVDDDVLDLFGADVTELGRGFGKDDADWSDWVLPDGTPCKVQSYIKPVKQGADWVVLGDEAQEIAIQKEGCLYFEQTCFPLLDSTDESFDNLPYQLDQVMWSRVSAPPAPLGLDAAGMAARAAGARALRASTDRAIVGLFGGNLLEIGEFLFRIDGFLYELAANPSRVHRFLDRIVEMHLANLQKYLASVGPYLDIIQFGDDLGTQTGPQISPRMYEEFFKPRHSLMWNRAKQLQPGLKVMLHCCGGVRPLLPHLIEAGLDIINPVQTTCTGMEPVGLKRDFGSDLVFWGGGCDTRDVLPNGTPAQVRDDVRRRVEVLAPGGGFVFQQVHNVMADVPPENVVAMFEAVRG
jgi:uroporphyrinogen decarboxylase